MTSPDPYQNIRLLVLIVALSWLAIWAGARWAGWL